MEVEAEASRPARPHPQLTQLDEIGILPLSPSSAYPLAPRIPTYSCTTDGIPVVMRKKGKGRSIAEELSVREGSEYMGVDEASVRSVSSETWCGAHHVAVAQLCVRWIY